MQFNITDLFPIGSDGTRSPLPKQRELLQKVLDPKGPKFLAYVSGIGGGKTLSGCIAMLAQAVVYPGTYLIAREFLPQLKDTTYKQFLDICPKELIIEHRIADLEIKLKAKGGVSTILFRQLEEPDKLKSLNLSGFLIDECDQVSEYAFQTLMGRLRANTGLRKGILVSNPAGHNWVYRWFVKQDFMQAASRKNYHLIRGTSLENTHLPEDYLRPMLESWSEDRIQREIMGSFDSFEGAVYDEFRRDVHVIKPFAIPAEWPRFIGIDHGYRNPAAWVWCAVGPDSEVYVYREFYKSEYLIHEIVNGKTDKNGTRFPGALDLMKHDPKPVAAFIDPSTKRRNSQNGESDFDEYVRNLPSTFPLYLAKNDVQVGIDRVKSYMKVHPKTNKPNLYVFDTCHNLIDEIVQYRYQELRPNQEGRKSEHEKPVKVQDHANDALRYVVVTLPEPHKAQMGNMIDKFQKEYPSEWKLKKFIHKLRNPTQKDPFTD